MLATENPGTQQPGMDGKADDAVSVYDKACLGLILELTHIQLFIKSLF